MFSSKQANNWVGRVLGFFTLTPFDYWRHSHAQHHMGSGNLTKRGIGDIDTLTLAEYKALSNWARLKYRIYRNPIILFGVGPIYVFLIAQRFPLDTFKSGRAGWMSVFEFILRKQAKKARQKGTDKQLTDQYVKF